VRLEPVMRRRELLKAALAGPLVARAANAPVRGRAVLAWGGRRLWRVWGGTAALLSETLHAAVAPVPVAGGCRFVAGDGTLGWCSHAGAPALATIALDAPVHALAASADARWTLAAHGAALSLFDAEARLVRRYAGSNLAGSRQGSANWLVHHRRRRSFVVAWPDLAELWEIQLDPAAPPIHHGLVHDYRMGEAVASPGFLGARRAPLALPLPAFGFHDDGADWVAGPRAGRLVVVHLDVRREIASFDLPEPRPAGALLRHDSGAGTWWVPAGEAVQRVDARRWLLLGRETPGAAVQALAAAGGTLWGLAGGAAAARLLRRGETGWTDAPEAMSAIGPPLALRADLAAQQLLAVGRSAWQRHAADGRLLERWVPPDAVALDGAEWSADPV
jgi:hypothetical protein